MALSFFGVDVVDGDEDACFFYVAKFVVDGCAEDFHGWREVHVGVDKWWYVFAKGTNFAVEC